MFSFRTRSPLYSAPVEREDLLMGTRVAQRVHGIGAAGCVELARAEIARLERLWSAFRADSEVSELGRRAGTRPVVVSPDTIAVLSVARELHALTLGAFDVTTGPLLQLWRAAVGRGREPSAAEIALARALVDGRDVELSGDSARLRRAGQGLDLGGIGKGYAADSCCAIYRSQGIRHAFLDLGGNVAVVGSRPDGSPWRVGIQAPERARGETVGFVEVQDCSVVTSGSYERGFTFGARRYSHIVDPRSGWPIAADVSSVAVISPSSTRADALATAMMVMGSARAYAFAEEHEIAALVFDNGGIRLTPGMANVFQAT